MRFCLADLALSQTTWSLQFKVPRQWEGHIGHLHLLEMHAIMGEIDDPISTDLDVVAQNAQFI